MNANISDLMLACLYTSDCMFVKFSMMSLLQITMDTYSVFDVRNESMIVSQCNLLINSIKTRQSYNCAMLYS